MQPRALFLIVEDNADDALLLKISFKKAGILNPCHIVCSGEEAVSYLNGAGKYANRHTFPLPEVILLDLNLPGMRGIELVRWIRQEPRLKGVQVVVLSGSDASRDVTEAYSAGADSYLIKPADLDRFVEFGKAFGGSWVWSEQVPEGGEGKSDRNQDSGQRERRPVPRARVGI